MSDSPYPRDVYKVALDIAENLAEPLYDQRTSAEEAAVVIESITNAILNERRRCLDLCRRIGSPEWSDDTNSGYELAAREIVEGIEKGR